MQHSFFKQRGFAMPAIFLAAAVAFAGSLAIETEDGTTLASKMGLGDQPTTEFASMEGDAKKDAAESK